MFPMDLLNLWSRPNTPKPLVLVIREALLIGKLLLRPAPARLQSEIVLMIDCNPPDMVLLLSVGDALPRSCCWGLVRLATGPAAAPVLVLSRFGALFDHSAVLFGLGLSMIWPRSRWCNVLGPHVFPFTPSAGTEIQAVFTTRSTHFVREKEWERDTYSPSPIFFILIEPFVCLWEWSFLSFVRGLFSKLMHRWWAKLAHIYVRLNTSTPIFTAIWLMHQIIRSIIKFWLFSIFKFIFLLNRIIISQLVVIIS